jgi:small ligand-binding sensory domain FIST
MQFASATTFEDTIESAIEVLTAQVEEQIGAGSIDLAIVFLSAQYTYKARALGSGLQTALAPKALLGCTAEGVIDKHHEIESRQAVALLAARMPGVQLEPFVLQPADSDWLPLLLDEEEFHRTVAAPKDTRLFLLLGDPFSTPMDDILETFNSRYASIPFVGGMASGALRPNGNALLLNDGVHSQGTVGLALAGAFDADVLVSQGCRPIDRPYKVHASHRNIILDLEGHPPLEIIEEFIPKLTDNDRMLLQKGLFIGRAIDTGHRQIGRGDFLIRGVIGIDKETGSITISDSVIDGETIQFHVRDAITAKEDLEMLLIPQMFREPPAGGLLFTCNGRGRKLYDHPDGDITVIQSNLKNTHLAGFFCAGEIGPIGTNNFLHGQTASLVLFRPSED